MRQEESSSTEPKVESVPSGQDAVGFTSVSVGEPERAQIALRIIWNAR